MKTDGRADTTRSAEAASIGSVLTRANRARAAGTEITPTMTPRKPIMIEAFAPEIENGMKKASPQNDTARRALEIFPGEARTGFYSPTAREKRCVSSNASLPSKFAL